jgi:hypothetical protein
LKNEKIAPIAKTMASNSRLNIWPPIGLYETTINPAVQMARLSTVGFTDRASSKQQTNIHFDRTRTETADR